MSFMKKIQAQYVKAGKSDKHIYLNEYKYSATKYGGAKIIIPTDFNTKEITFWGSGDFKTYKGEIFLNIILNNNNFMQESIWQYQKEGPTHINGIHWSSKKANEFFDYFFSGNPSKFAQKVAKTLSVPVENIKITAANTSELKKDFGNMIEISTSYIG